MAERVFINLDRPREIKYGTNALCQLEAMLNKPLSEIDDEKIGIADARALLYVPLHREDKSITLEMAGDFIDEYGMEYCMSKVTEAIRNSTQGWEDQKNLNTVI